MSESNSPFFYAVPLPPGYLSEGAASGYYTLQSMSVAENTALHKWLAAMDPNVKYQIAPHLAPYIPSQSMSVAENTTHFAKDS